MCQLSTRHLLLTTLRRWSYIIASFYRRENRGSEWRSTCLQQTQKVGKARISPKQADPRWQHPQNKTTTEWGPAVAETSTPGPPAGDHRGQTGRDSTGGAGDVGGFAAGMEEKKVWSWTYPRPVIRPWLEQKLSLAQRHHRDLLQTSLPKHAWTLSPQETAWGTSSLALDESLCASNRITTQLPLS